MSAKNVAFSRNKIRNLISLFLICFISHVISSSAQAEDTLTPVTLQLKWKHQAQFAGYYMAIEKGYYAEFGIDLSLIEKQLHISDVQPVLDNQATFGITNSSILIPIMNKEPLVIVSTIYQHSPLAFISKKESGIFTPYQFKGKKISLRSIEDQASLYALLLKLDIKDSDYESIPESTFDKLVLEDGLVDVTTAYVTNQPFAYESAGIPVVTIEPRNYGIDFYGDLIFTNVETLSKNPELVKNFVAASIKGWHYALDHPEETIEHIQAHYQTEQSRDALHFELEKSRELIAKDIIPLGSSFKERFESIAKVYKDLGLVNKNAVLDKYIIEDYITEPKSLSKQHLIQGLIIFAVLLLVTILLVINNKVLSKRVEKRTNDLDEKLALIEQQNKELEQARLKAEQASRVKTRFLSNMSHEIRTPLFGITALTELLDTEELQEKQKKYVTLLRRTTHHLGGIVNDILDYSKITGGMLSIKRIPFSIRSLLADISNQYEILAIEKNISFEVFINPDAPDELIGDPQRIKQIFQNLCSNAIKFTVKGGIQVSLQIKQTEQKDKFKLSICVQDTGIGIRKEMQHKLFKPFEQIESEDNRHFEGSGLGLSITRQLCDLMGATIEFESELNKGTKASVVMLLELSNAFLIDNDKDPKLSSPLSILLLGSDIAELKRRASALAKKGVTIFIQNSQQAAISHLSQHHVDIILTSLFDPQIDSPEFINAARENSKNQRIKIIITSNYAEVEARALLKPSEVDAILSLPTSLFHITNGLLTEQALDKDVEQKQLDILLVEDNLLNQELMLNMLMRCSKDISVANNGKECLEVLNEKQNFDIILMDIQMPVMDGVEAMREIRKNKTISQIPVIAVTANALSDDVETYLNAGFAKHISKPFSSEQLINSIYSLVRK